MASSVQTAVTQAVGQVKDQFSKLTPNQQYAVAIAGGLSTVYLLSQLGGKREASSASKPSSFELTGGSIAKGNVKKEFQAYAASFGKEAGDGECRCVWKIVRSVLAVIGEKHAPMNSRVLPRFHHPGPDLQCSHAHF